MMMMDRRIGVEMERSRRMLKIGVRSPVATDLNRQKGSGSSTAKRSATVAMSAERESRFAALHRQW